MTPKELVKAVINDVEALQYEKDVNRIHGWTSRIFGASKDLKSIDEDAFVKFQKAMEHLKYLTEEQIEYLPLIIETSLENLQIIKTKIENPGPRNFLKASKPVFTDSYIKAKANFSSNKKAIDGTEKDILTVEIYVDRLHDPITSGKFANYRHARVTENLRIFYHIEGDFVVFDDILTKNEFDKVN